MSFDSIKSIFNDIQRLPGMILQFASCNIFMEENINMKKIILSTDKVQVLRTISHFMIFLLLNFQNSSLTSKEIGFSASIENWK